MIIGGTRSVVMSNNSVSIAGFLQHQVRFNNTLSPAAHNSLAIGNRISLLAPSIFAWSDFEPNIYDDIDYGDVYYPEYFTGSQPNTSIARSYNGFAINKIQPTKQ